MTYTFIILIWKLALCPNFGTVPIVILVRVAATQPPIYNRLHADLLDRTVKELTLEMNLQKRQQFILFQWTSENMKLVLQKGKGESFN